MRFLISFFLLNIQHFAQVQFHLQSQVYESVHHRAKYFCISSLNIGRYNAALFANTGEKNLVLIAKSTSSSQDPAYYPDIMFSAMINIYFILHTLMITKIYYRRHDAPEKDSFRRNVSTNIFCNRFKKRCTFEAINFIKINETPFIVQFFLPESIKNPFLLLNHFNWVKKDRNMPISVWGYDPI